MQQCNFIDWRNLKIVYKRYASLYFVCAIDADDNELVTLDMIHHFVEVLDKHFSNVCELDLVFHFYKAYWLMDEVFLAGTPRSSLLWQSGGNQHNTALQTRQLAYQCTHPAVLLMPT